MSELTPDYSEAEIVAVRTVVIEGRGIAAGVTMGVEPVDLVMFHVDAALKQLTEDGANILEHAVVLIGRHPDHPEDLTVQAKSAARLTSELLEGQGDGNAAV